MSEQLPDTLRPDVRDDEAQKNAAGDDGADAQKSPEVEFALVLSRMIDETARNPSQLRNAVYELARLKLRADTSSGAFADRRRLMQAFDTAVGGVETFYQRQEAARASLPSTSSPTLIGGPASEAAPDDGEPHTLLIDHAGSEVSVPQPATDFTPRQPQPRRSTRPLLALGTLALLAVAALAWRFGGQSLPRIATPPSAPELAAAPVAEAAPAAPPPRLEQPALAEQPASRPDLIAPGIPVPSTYGVYAVGGGQLTQLNALPGRVPDQRVFMSTAITQPSQTMLPDGRVQFVIFRRDLGASIPDRMAVRVIAKVKTDATSDGKRPSVAAEETWTVRSNAFDFRVSPVPGQPEMLTLRPDKDDLQLSAGRYGLILKGQAYDFTVAGEITDPAQCLERMAALNGTFYVECGANTGR